MLLHDLLIDKILFKLLSDFYCLPEESIFHLKYYFLYFISLYLNEKEQNQQEVTNQTFHVFKTKP